MAYDLKNYTDVAARLKLAHNTWQSIIVHAPVMLSPVTGYIQATVTLKDGRTAYGTAHFRLDLSGQRAQATHPLEDAETSAVGRALGFFGFGTDKNFPSAEEMDRVNGIQENIQNGTYAPPAGDPAAVANAEEKFWEKWAPSLGGRRWANVQKLLGAQVEKPTTIEEWRQVYAAVKAEFNQAQAEA